MIEDLSQKNEVARTNISISRTSVGIKKGKSEWLLVFEVRECRGALCQFLGVPEPKEPFPGINDTKEQLDRLAKAKAKRMCAVLDYGCYWELRRITFEIPHS